jgi:hypothetical protein
MLFEAVWGDTSFANACFLIFDNYYNYSLRSSHHQSPRRVCPSAVVPVSFGLKTEQRLSVSGHRTMALLQGPCVKVTLTVFPLGQIVVTVLLPPFGTSAIIMPVSFIKVYDYLYYRLKRVYLQLI